MRTSVFSAVAFAAVASAQSSSVDAFPQTSLLQQTNSLGVVTGMFPVATSQPNQPAAVTNQPSVVTSQPPVANIPAVGTGIQTLVLPGTGSAFNQTRTVVVSASNSTTVILNGGGASASASGSAASGSGRTTGASGSGASASRSGTATGTGAPANSQGAAANVKIAGSFVGLGAFVAAFL